VGNEKTVNMKLVAKISDIRNFSQNIRSDVKNIRSGNTGNGTAVVAF